MGTQDESNQRSAGVERRSTAGPGTHHHLRLADSDLMEMRWEVAVVR